MNLADLYNLTPAALPPLTARRLVLGMTGPLPPTVRGRRTTSPEIARQREAIYAAIVQSGGNPHRDEIAATTGIHPEIVTSRLNWLSTHGLVRCSRRGGMALWEVVERMEAA